MVETCKTLARHARIEQGFLRLLRRHGVDAAFDLPDVSNDSTSDEMSCSDGAYRAASNPPIIPANRTVDMDPQEPQISAKKAKRWLESLELDGVGSSKFNE